MTAHAPTGAPASASDAVVIPEEIEKAIEAYGEAERDEGRASAFDRNFGEQYESLDALKRAIAAALAPPAVPESVRRLSEAATPGTLYTVDQPWGDGTWIVAGNPDPHAGFAVADCEGMFERENERLDAPEAIRDASAANDAAFLAASANYVRTLLSTPSGRADTPLAGGGVVAGEVRSHIENLECIGRHHDSNGICRKAVDAGIAALKMALTSQPKLPPLINSTEIENAAQRIYDRQRQALPDQESINAQRPFGQNDVPIIFWDGYRNDAKAAFEPYLATAPEPAAGGGREIVRRMAAASRSLAEFPPDGLVKGDLYVAVKNEGHGTGWSYRTVGLTVGDLDEARSILSAPSGAETAGGDEPCKHKETTARYDHSVCTSCGMVWTGVAGWTIAKKSWFRDLDEARFFEKHGRLPEPPATAGAEGGQA